MNSKVYWANVLICISVIIFCGVKVMLDPQPTTTSIYLPIMSGIVGYFVPSPLKKKDNENNLLNNGNPITNPNNISSNISTNSSNSIPQSPPLSPMEIRI